MRRWCQQSLYSGHISAFQVHLVLFRRDQSIGLEFAKILWCKRMCGWCKVLNRVTPNLKDVGIYALFVYLCTSASSFWVLSCRSVLVIRHGVYMICRSWCEWRMWKPLFVKIMYYFLKHVVLGIFYALYLFSFVTVNLAVEFAVYVSMAGKSFYYSWDWLEAFQVGKICSKFAYWLCANLVLCHAWSCFWHWLHLCEGCQGIADCCSCQLLSLWLCASFLRF
jgi:hypothetical protein